MDDKIESGIENIFKYIIPPFSKSSVDLVSTITSLVIIPIVMACTQDSIIYFILVPDIFTEKVGPIPIMVILYIPSVLLIAYTLFFTIR